MAGARRGPRKERRPGEARRALPPLHEESRAMPPPPATMPPRRRCVRHRVGARSRRRRRCVREKVSTWWIWWGSSSCSGRRHLPRRPHLDPSSWRSRAARASSSAGAAASELAEVGLEVARPPEGRDRRGEARGGMTAKCGRREEEEEDRRGLGCRILHIEP